MENNLTQGNILKKLAFLAFPIMGTSFLQMAYNMVDMIWIGRLGSDSVAAVGTAGYFMWFSMALIALGRIGGEVNVAQALGGKDTKKANVNVSTVYGFVLVLAVLYSLIMLGFKGPMVAFFNLNNAGVETMAESYIMIVAFGMPFSFFNQVTSAFYNASGKSHTPFMLNSVGLVLNLALDPLLIFGLDMGVRGAALATIISQMIVTVLMVVVMLGENKPYKGFCIKERPSIHVLRGVLKISVPVALQSGLFTIIAAFVARIIAIHGTTAIAVQKVGSQIEALSYMTAQGFGAALSAFVGQNYGAKKFDRVKEGFKQAGIIMSVVGVIVSVALFVFAEPIFKIFIQEEEALAMGVIYLRILSFSQLFMCIEITLAGGFNGLGKSTPPAIISVVFNFLRIPFAYFLSVYTVLGLNGVWWSISVSSVFKGTILVMVLVVVLRKLPENG